MSVFSTGLPATTGDDKRDIAALQTWACQLISELRSLFYKLDASNVMEAKTVKASGIKGAIDISRIQIPNVRIYYDEEASALVIESDGQAIYLGSDGVYIEGDVDIRGALTVNGADINGAETGA